MNSIWQFLAELGPDMLECTWQHFYLTFLAMVLASAIALPLGVYLTRCPWNWLVGAVMGSVALVQTIPSLGLVAFIVILFGMIHLPTIGVVPALVALVLYALLPILRNTYTGLKQVDPTAVEVAVGLGMRRRQVLFSVELPLSVPVIMAGIRISTVWTVGVAALCTLIGAGGLGDLIMRGLRTLHMGYFLAGVIPAALLAIVLDWGLARLERWLTPEGMQNEAKVRA
jgi:osmoprotectant transport system permease protein